MRPGLAAETLLERLGTRLNLAPLAAGEAILPPALTRAITTTQKLGLFGALLDGPREAASLAGELGLDPEATRLLLDVVALAGHLERSCYGEYVVAPRARKWLDPGSPTYIGTFIENCHDYWAWWDRLEDVVRTGESERIHDYAPDDPHWQRYIRGQFELARLSAPEVSRRVRVPAGAESLLDLAGAHGWYAASVCRRHDGLRATVLDLPASAAVGREILREAGAEDRVEHHDGDLLSDDLGGPHDVVLLFNIVHHFRAEQNRQILARVAAALRPGGTVAILDLFSTPVAKPPDGGSIFGLFFFLTSAAAVFPVHALSDWLRDAGFDHVRDKPVRTIPHQRLVQARRI